MSKRFKSAFEREDVGKVQKVEIAIALTAWLLIAWIGFNSPDQAVRNTAFALNTLMAIVAVMWAVDIVHPKNDYVESIGFGKKKNAKTAALLGLGFAILFYSFASANAKQALIVPFSVSALAGLALLAAVVEEIFFRSVLAPTFARLFESDLAAWAGNALLFGGFHWLAYGAAMPAILTAMVFGTIMLAGNTYLKSTTFSYTAHIAYNFMVIGGFAWLVGVV